MQPHVPVVVEQLWLRKRKSGFILTISGGCRWWLSLLLLFVLALGRWQVHGFALPRTTTTTLSFRSQQPQPQIPRQFRSQPQQQPQQPWCLDQRPFSPSQPHRSSSSTMALFMGSGKGLNKQAELRRKMELAKQQKQQQQQQQANQPATNTADDENSNQQQQRTSQMSRRQTSMSTTSSLLLLSEKEIKERNDRLRFAELLKKSAASVWNDYSKDGYLNKQQEEEEILAAVQQRKRPGRVQVDRLFEGDPAPVDCFAELCHVRTETPIGKAGMERLLPWLKSNNNNYNNPANNNKDNKTKEFVLCLVDPRDKSVELRQAVKNLVTSLSPDLLRRVIVINADSPAENRRWIKRNQYALVGDGGGNGSGTTTTTTTLRNCLASILSDEKMEWMRVMTALGEERWSMTLYLIDETNTIQRLVRQVDMYAIVHVVEKAVESFRNEIRLNNKKSNQQE